ncbi:MAG: hypothetical protein U0791_08880 [Gemmataceae bacterium]
MAKAKQTKEAGMPVIIALVFFIVTTIGLGVFVYVLFSDQEVKDAAVTAAKKDVTDMRAARDEAQLLARIYRVAMGIPEGAGNESDTVLVQDGAKEGSKGHAEIKKINEALKKRGSEVTADAAAKFDAEVDRYLKALAAGGAAPPKFDSTTLFNPNEFDIWPGDVDANKQPLLPRRTILDVAARAALVRNFSAKAIVDERGTYDKNVGDLNTARTGYVASQAAYNKQAADLPNTFNMKIAEKQKEVDDAKKRYQDNEATTRKEIQKREDQIEAMKLDILNRDKAITALRDQIVTLTAKQPKSDPFAYDEPLGKITARLADNIVEINLGSNAHVQAGLTFTVLPIDFPQKGRVSRMMKFRAPDNKGIYRETEMFMPKASIEVIEVIGPDVARCRITTEHDDVRDRVLPGDLLYNSVWRKGQADHIALVGIFDLNGDGTDDIENLVRDLNKMGIPVDAYFDLKTQKWVGKLTERTRYLVDGAIPVPVPNDPNLEAKTKLIGAMKAARDEATGKLVQTVPARDFFGRTGYRAKIDVSDDFINQAAAKYLTAPPPAPPAGNNN